MKKVLFIHVPKTSGSSLKSLLRDSLGDFFIQANSSGQLERADPLLGRVRDLEGIREVLERHSGLALHVDASFDAQNRTTDFRSLAWHVFAPEHAAYFAQFTVLTMLREPFRRFLSEYAFVQRVKQADPGFLPDLAASSLEAYLQETHENVMLHFLLEPQLSRRRSLTRADLARVQERILECPIHVGIYERYDESIAYFARLLGRGFAARDVPSHNRGGEPPVHDAALQAAFYARNGLDVELYDFALRLLDQRLAEAGVLPRAVSGSAQA